MAFAVEIEIENNVYNDLRTYNSTGQPVLNGQPFVASSIENPDVGPFAFQTPARGNVHD
jgi:hypothetical protein